MRDGMSDTKRKAGQRRYAKAARASLKEGDRAGAIASYEEGIVLGMSDCTIGLGHLYIREGRLSAAEEVFSRAVDQGDSQHLAELARIRLKRGDKRGAIGAFERGVVLDAPDCVTGLANLHFKDGRFEDAQAVLTGAVQRGGFHHFTHLARLALKLGDEQRAVEHYQRGVSRNVPECVEELGQLFEKSRDLGAAETVFAAAVAKGQFDQCTALARVRVGRSDEAGAVEALRLGIDHGVRECVTELSTFYSSRGDLDSAHEVIEAAIERGEVHHYLSLARIKRMEGDRTGAIATYRLGIAHNRADCFGELKRLYLREGDVAAARALNTDLREPAPEPASQSPSGGLEL